MLLNLFNEFGHPKQHIFLLNIRYGIIEDQEIPHKVYFPRRISSSFDKYHPAYDAKCGHPKIQNDLKDLTEVRTKAMS